MIAASNSGRQRVKSVSSMRKSTLCAQLIRPIPHHLRSKNVPQMEQAIGRRRKTGERASHGVLYAG